MSWEQQRFRHLPALVRVPRLTAAEMRVFFGWQYSAFRVLPLPLAGERSGMEGAHCSTVYRGLPYLGGRPLPATHTSWQRWGSWSSLSLSPRSGSRAVGTRLRGKCRRCISGFVVRSGNLWRLIAPATKRMYLQCANRRERQREQTPIRPAAAFALDQLSLGATSAQRSWRPLRWDTRGKKHNACVERSGVPLFFK